MTQSPSGRSSLVAAAIGGAWHVLVLLLLLLPFFVRTTSAVSTGQRRRDISDTTPDSTTCCRRRGVSEFCVQKLCNIREPPNEFDVFEVASDCPHSLNDVAECLSDGRDHSKCCRSKSRGVEHSCLHLCDGSSTKLNVTQWDDYKAYVACLSFNARSMYECMREGYTRIPGPPLDVSYEATGTSSATISWRSPNILASKVRSYIVRFRSSSDSSTWNTVNVKSTNYDLTDLAPDTEYTVDVASVGLDEDAVSVRSTSLKFVTAGSAPTAEAYTAEVFSTVGASKSLVCKIYEHGSDERNLSVVWYRKRESESTFTLLPKQQLMDESGGLEWLTYSSGRKTFVSVLTLRRVDRTDFGLYKCVAKNGYGEASVDVTLMKSNSLKIPSAPPNVTECCVREGVREDCLSACRSDATSPVNVSTFQSTLLCATDIPKVTHCALEQKNYGSCCLRRRVPFECLSICDGSSRSSLATKVFCAEYNSAIFSCLWEEKSSIPSPPVDLRTKSVHSAKAVVEWSMVPSADVYHVYYKRASDVVWRRTTVGNTSAVLNNLSNSSTYFVQILSANGAGNSDASRLLTFRTNNKRGGAEQNWRDSKRKRRNNAKALSTSHPSSFSS